MIRSKIKNIFLIFVLLFGINYIFSVAPRSIVLASIKAKAIDYTKNLDIQQGDFIFQHLPGPLTEMIADVSHSSYSHCGIVVNKKGQFFVLEAIGPVKETPINEWISRGEGDKITIVRLKRQYQKHMTNIIKEAYYYLKRPYDILYEWDDQKIYCSELIYKAVLKGSGIRLADFDRLGDLDWQSYEEQIRYITGGILPLDREMITPEALVSSKFVYTIYTTFSNKVLSQTLYQEQDLKGFWIGQYTLVDTTLKANFIINDHGIIQDGNLMSGLFFSEIPLNDFNKKTGFFRYSFLSANNVKIHVTGYLDKSKKTAFGRWKDSLGYWGVFNIEKKNT